MRGDTFDMVIFGGAGDLATRKLIPALYYLNKDCQIQGSSRILCTGRSAMDQAAMRDQRLRSAKAASTSRWARQ